MDPRRREWRRELGVQVWATDLWFSAAERLDRIRDAGVEDGVFGDPEVWLDWQRSISHSLG